MHESSDGKLTCALIDGLAFSNNIDITLLKNFYNDAISIELFVTDGIKYWSERVLRNKEILDGKRRLRSEAGKRGMQSRWGKDNSVITENNSVIKKDNSVITENNKVKESKVKESKVNIKDILSSKIFSDDSHQILLTKKLFDLIKQNNPKVKNPNLQSWATDIDKLIRLDNRTPDEIEKVIDWCQKDTFWHKNILSAKKLREKYDQLFLNMKNPNKSAPKQEWKEFPQRQYDKEFFNSLYKEL
jgi:hypothetical protein